MSRSWLLTRGSLGDDVETTEGLLLSHEMAELDTGGLWRARNS